jgi:hypothetical protein
MIPVRVMRCRGSVPWRLRPETNYLVQQALRPQKVQRRSVSARVPSTFDASAGVVPSARRG